MVSAERSAGEPCPAPRTAASTSVLPLIGAPRLGRSFSWKRAVGAEAARSYVTAVVRVCDARRSWVRPCEHGDNGTRAPETIDAMACEEMVDWLVEHVLLMFQS